MYLFLHSEKSTWNAAAKNVRSVALMFGTWHPGEVPMCLDLRTGTVGKRHVSMWGCLAPLLALSEVGDFASTSASMLNGDGYAVPQVCWLLYFNPSHLRLWFPVLNWRAELPSLGEGRVKERLWQQVGHSLAQGVYSSMCAWNFFRWTSFLQNDSRRIKGDFIGFSSLFFTSLPPFLIILPFTCLSVICHPDPQIIWPCKCSWQPDILSLRGLLPSYSLKMDFEWRHWSATEVFSWSLWPMEIGPFHLLLA